MWIKGVEKMLCREKNRRKILKNMYFFILFLFFIHHCFLYFFCSIFLLFLSSKMEVHRIVGDLRKGDNRFDCGQVLIICMHTMIIYASNHLHDALHGRSFDVPPPSLLLMRGSMEHDLLLKLRGREAKGIPTAHARCVLRG
jgi:hypothetical protein